METLLLARHAHSVSNRAGLASCRAPGDGLTAEGIAEARRLATAVADDEIELGVASRLRRTQETLELALGSREVPRIVAPTLDEVNFGDHADGPLEDYRRWAVAADPSTRAPGGGESRAELAARYAGGFRELLERQEASALVVAHALCLRYVVDAAHGLVPAALITPVGNAAVFRLASADVLAAVELLEGWSRAPRFRPLEAARVSAQLSDG